MKYLFLIITFCISLYSYSQGRYYESYKDFVERNYKEVDCLTISKRFGYKASFEFETKDKTIKKLLKK